MSSQSPVPTEAIDASPFPTTEHIASIPGEALLGNYLGNFISKFGQPFAESDRNFPPFYFKSNADTSIGYFDIQLASYLPIRQRVINIEVISPPTSWGPAKAGKICNSFAPKDAQFMYQVQDFGGSGDVLFGVVLLYKSKTLANIFSGKIDYGRKLPNNDVFEIEYFYHTDTNHDDTSRIDRCSIFISLYKP